MKHVSFGKVAAAMKEGQLSEVKINGLTWKYDASTSKLYDTFNLSELNPLPVSEPQLIKEQPLIKDGWMLLNGDHIAQKNDVVVYHAHDHPDCDPERVFRDDIDHNEHNDGFVISGFAGRPVSKIIKEEIANGASDEVSMWRRVGPRKLPGNKNYGKPLPLP